MRVSGLHPFSTSPVRPGSARSPGLAPGLTGVHPFADVEQLEVAGLEGTAQPAVDV